ncbi:MAG: hypothetical protein QOH86_1249 [Sphingomonadales bacterium]|jgi:hypothetical protein|nr:hypothetical protein [Sphingomonadales bacterium]
MKRLIGKGATRLIASLFIWFVFMVLLMTAVTQQSVSARIDKSALDLGYSGTLALVKDFNLRQQELPDLRRAQTELLKQLNRDEVADQDAQGKYHDSWDAVLPIIRLLSKVPECEIAYDPKKPVRYDARAGLWQQAKACVDAHADKISPKIIESVNTSGFPELHRKAVTTGDAVKKIQKQVDEGAAAIARAANPSADEAKAIASFRDADVLRGFLVTRWLVDFPPPILQLLLSASAGAFGALLITLILLVYPKTDLKFSSSGGFWERIMLGGFIAVCVYIVLLGGTAVLGTASFDQAGANYMTFCAISVLAGMFSDRVAHWLSNRADLFFKEQGAGEAPPVPVGSQ